MRSVNAGCENAVEVKADVACKCGAAFCFQCTEEAHRPVSRRTLPDCLSCLPECSRRGLHSTPRHSTPRHALHARAMMAVRMLPGCWALSLTQSPL